MKTGQLIAGACRPLLLAMILAALFVVSAQAAYASGFTVDVKVDPSSVSVNSTATITIYVHDTDDPGMKFKDAPINLTVIHPSGNVEYFEKAANESGMYALPFKATAVGNYTLQARADYVYTGDYGLPIGMVTDTSDKVTLTSKAGLNFPGGIVRPSNFVIITPAANATPQAPTPTAQPATPTPSTATATPQTGAPTPVGTTDIAAPVTMLNLTGNTTEAGEYTSDVLCTLTAQDNEGGSGVSVIQYSFDGSNWFTYQQPFSVVKPGVTTVYYRSADNAGNVEVANVKAIVIAGATQAPSATPSPSATAQAAPGFSMSITAIALIGLAAVLLVAGRAGKK